MPPGQPGLLTRKEYGALAAYILSSNGQKAPGRIAIGSKSAEPAQLAAEKPNASTGDRPNLFGIETPEALAASAAIVKMALVQNQSLARYTPVTDRKSVVEGQCGSVRVDHGGRRNITKTNKVSNQEIQH